MASDDADERPPLDAVTEWPGGITWIGYPEEDARRASHALETDAGVWLVDPVDADGLDDRVADLGDVAGVVVLQDRHTRDAAAVAGRHDVPVSVPGWMDLTRENLDATAEPIDSALPGTGYEVHALIDAEEWEEALLVDEGAATMVVPEALGTLPAFTEGGHDVGLHPALDDPPSGLTGWSPDRLLVGHGEGVHGDAAERIAEALDAG
jgi:hypothetical protein